MWAIWRRLTTSTQACTARESAERAARAQAVAAARAKATRDAAAARQAEAVASAAELAEMQARRELEESDHTLAERTAAAEQDLGSPWDPAAVSDSDSGKPMGFPRFSGDKAKGSLPLTTFFEMFDLWFQLSRLPLAQKGARAQLALEGKAATQWCNLKQTLRDAGKDVYDYTVVKYARIAQYAPISPGMIVRQRLHKLKQTGSVESYHEEFRTIAAEAVNHPVKGAEACYIFLDGLKAGVRERITTDPDTRDEYTNIDKLVAEALMWQSLPAQANGRTQELRARCRSRKGKKAPHLGGLGGGGRGDRRQPQDDSRRSAPSAKSCRSWPFWQLPQIGVRD